MRIILLIMAILSSKTLEADILSVCDLKTGQVNFSTKHKYPKLFIIEEGKKCKEALIQKIKTSNDKKNKNYSFKI
tara:strand:+ start:23843 stop:24067 length:225 start_codon:yes stop_codon:yes gene_type:complete